MKVRASYLDLSPNVTGQRTKVLVFRLVDFTEHKYDRWVPGSAEMCPLVILRNIRGVRFRMCQFVEEER